MKKLLSLAFVLLPAVGINAQATTEINDQNTPLHLMQPQYEIPYGIPQETDVKATIDRVLAYLETEMPARVDNGKLARGSFRLTSYEAGVLYSAMVAASQATGDNRYMQFTADRLNLIAKQAKAEAKALEKDRQFDAQMRMVLYPGALDDCGAMASAYCRLRPLLVADKKMKEKDLQDYDAVISRYVDFVRNKQYRMPDGTFARHRPHHNTVWLDDMYMGVPCMAWYSNVFNDAAAMADAVNQIRLFKQKMWIEFPSIGGAKGGLFRHGWVESMRPHPAYHWGRANGWAILTMCEVLDAMPKDHKDRPFVMRLLRKHIQGLSALQDKTGFWHQLIDRPDTYLETSCTAIYTYCIAHAINEGWIDGITYGAQAYLGWQACQTKVNEKGQVEGTCVGTGMGFEPAFYAYRPVHKMAAHGYGPMIWAGAEIVRMLKNTHPKMNDSAVHLYPTEQKTNKPIFVEDAHDEEILW